jgi:hypothetical protein
MILFHIDLPILVCRNEIDPTAENGSIAPVERHRQDSRVKGSAVDG